jgi:uncharacterized protein
MNRLANETSPYLLQHADNPVDWYPWGEEALARAREEDKPVLLSVGYAACHWCHVMEHESFEDEETAALMNERFVNIKVDREERPDLDAIYMDAVVALSGHGGWPMTMFLTPEGGPFYGGTYFPPTARMGMPSFRDVLTAVADAYSSRRSDVVEQAARLTDAIRQTSQQQPSREPLTEALLSQAVVTLAQQFDRQYGGFGGAPKFPPASVIEFLLRMELRGAPSSLEMATMTLDAMADGGMYDQLGGGFHRYSVDAYWLVPHFEKMLYDNALLASAYLHGWLVTGRERYREVVEETLDYLLREMGIAEGGFASAQDADTLGEEGLTYVWSYDELIDVLGPDNAEAVIRRFGATPAGNFEGSNILHVGDASVEVAKELREALLAVRARRPQPLRDDKALAAWNGLALSAFADAGLRLGREDYLAAAGSLAEFLLTTMSDGEGRLYRTYRAGQAKISAYLEDYANVANGLLDLYTATGELRMLEEARRLALLSLELFSDGEHGGFFFTPQDGEPLVARKKQLDDSPTPSGNSMLAYVLLRLSRVYGDGDLERKAVDVFRLAYRALERAPSAVGHLLCALELHFAPPREVALVGDDPSLRAVAFERFAPNTVYAFAEKAGDPAIDRVPLLVGKDLVDGKPAAYVCERFSCRAPVTDAEALREALAA